MTRGKAILVAACALATACATTYRPRGLTGGFSETRLSETTFEVRFQGNGYTSRERVNQLLLRRCAELTLEAGRRYFEIVGGDQENQIGAGGGWLFNFPNGVARVRVLGDVADSKFPADAVTVVAETDAMAGGALSERARTTLAGIR